MNEKLQYATMLEIPVNTCNVTFKPTKKRNKKRKKEVNPEAVKEQLLNKINQQQEQAQEEDYLLDANENFEQAVQDKAFNQSQLSEESLSEDNAYQTVSILNVNEKRKKRAGRFPVVGVQLAVIGVLIATIFLTNAFYADSGINVFMREIFAPSKVEQVVDDRTYDQFSPVLALSDSLNASVGEGVINFSGEGSVYSPCDGKVVSVVKGEDGRYSLEIAHSENFTSVLSGLIYAYAGVGDEVFFNVPVGYVSEEGATMCFMGQSGALISGYQIVDNSVVWAV